MSNEIFPALPGIKWGTTRKPMFSTRKVASVSGYEVRVSQRAYPTYSLSLQYEFLRNKIAAQELSRLLGLFERHRGSADSFLFLDSLNYAVTNQAFGVGSGSQQVFQLVAAWAGFVQPASNIKSCTAIKRNGAALTLGADYTLGSNGTVSFTVAPAAGAVLTWTGDYYMRARFADDYLDVDTLWRDMWEAKKVELVAGYGRQIG